MNNAPKQIAGVLLYTVKGAVKQFCKKKTRQLDNLLKAGACSNAANTQVNKCYTKLIDKYLGIQNSQDDKKKMPWLCCSFYEILECIPRDVQGVKKCTPIAVDSMLGFIRSMTGNIIDMFCSDYTEGSDKCEKLVSVHSGSATRAPVDVEKPTGEDRPNADDGARDRPDPRAENDSLGTDGDEVRFSLTGKYGGFLE
ncbi:unnamed protein product, partial [Oppiella nova]